MLSTHISPSQHVGLQRSTGSLHTIVGLPTVYRKDIGTKYLIGTLKGLIAGLKARHATKNDVLIQVTIGELNATISSQIVKEVQSNFPNELDQGLINVLVPQPSFYPSLSYSRDKNFGDTGDRQKWRTKQNLDYIFMWLHAIKLQPTYFLQLEDDLEVSADFFAGIETKVEKLNEQPHYVQDWKMIDFTHVGFIGKFFKLQLLREVRKFEI